jgi:hypothetical protein
VLYDHLFAGRTSQRYGFRKLPTAKLERNVEKSTQLARKAYSPLLKAIKPAPALNVVLKTCTNAVELADVGSGVEKFKIMTARNMVGMRPS